MKIYISGPMTGVEDHNYPAFFAAEERLLAQGHEVINPARLGVVEGWTWQQYLKRDLKVMMDADAVALLPNWIDSKGAKLEVLNAIKLDMPVYEEETMAQLDIEMMVAVGTIKRVA